MPEAEVRKRWQQNRGKARRGDVRDDDFAPVVRQFEPPTPDERVIPCNPLDPITWLEGFVAQILAEVSAAK